jgi:ankyrin repeat protein
MDLAPLIAAIMNDKPKDVERQLNSVYINDRTEEGCSPIFYAVLAGNASIVKQLIEKGADPNCVAEEPGATIMAETPLSLALQKRHLSKDAKFDEIIALLRKYGATETGNV